MQYDPLESKALASFSEETLSATSPALYFHVDSLAFIRKGRAILRVADWSLACEEHVLLCLPAASGASLSASPECRFALVALQGSATGELSRRLANAFSAGPRPLTVSLPGSRRLEDCLRRCAAERDLPGLCGSDLLVALTVEFLVHALRELPGPTAPLLSAEIPKRGRGPWRVEEVVSYIEKNYSETFSLEDFVARCALNTSEFSRRFKVLTGCPLFEFINRKRVQRACSLLKDGDLPIIEIAFSVGYNNLSFFNRYFLRLMGQTPSEYRRRNR
jgi:AraC-like DNA-binding protein